MATLLVLYESASGYALFQKKEYDEVAQMDDAVQQSLLDLSKFGKAVKLKAFTPFKSAEDALANINAVSEGVAHETLVNFLEMNFPKSKKAGKYLLGVSEEKLGGSIQEQCDGVKCVKNQTVTELQRVIRLHFDKVLSAFKEGDLEKAQLGLGHSYSRCKVKFNVNRVDNMIIQSIALLDQLNKDINTFAMRVREWYSWHFPELARLVKDNIMFARLAATIRRKEDANESLRDRLEEVTLDSSLTEKILAAIKSSMGQDISPVDLLNICTFSERVISLDKYRTELEGYLHEKMGNVAPNLSALVGDTVGARLISHAGSLTSLAKYPASTVQILGAEKALFRALKTRGNTPKYGLIYHSTFIGRASAANKGRISRYLANKCSLASRIDCFSNESTDKFGLKLREQVEDRLRFYDTGEAPAKNIDVMHGVVAALEEERGAAGSDEEAELPASGKKRSRRASDDDDMVEAPKKKKKKKKSSRDTETGDASDMSVEDVSKKSKKDKKKKKEEKELNVEVEKVEGGERKKKKKKKEKRRGNPDELTLKRKREDREGADGEVEPKKKKSRKEKDANVEKKKKNKNKIKKQSSGEEERGKSASSSVPSPANGAAAGFAIPEDSVEEIATFDSSFFPAALTKACLAQFETPTEVQRLTWPPLLRGRDVVAVAETGSGKTLSFALPALRMIAQRRHAATQQDPQVLSLSPTRELASQVADVFSTFGAHLNPAALSVCIYGGVPKYEQKQKLRRGVDVVVATPGRLIDLLSERALSLASVSYLILDEADRLLDEGFEKDIERIVTSCARQRQTVMFSATWPESVQALASSHMKNPMKIVVGKEDLQANSRITQIVELVEQRDKDYLLLKLLSKYHKSRKNKILVFALYKKEAARVETMLNRKGWQAASIHGDKSQHERTRALQEFSTGRAPLLVATDVAARGLDIPNVEYVINYTFPLTVEEYVHRIGRTGRAGKTGVAHTFFTRVEKGLAGDLVEVLKGCDQPVPPEIERFGPSVKKRKKHAMYGTQHNSVDMDAKPKRQTFDSDSE